MMLMSRSSILVSWLATFGLAVPAALGQAPTVGGYEAKCAEFSGNPRRDETICLGFEFSDGTSNISAGLATTTGLEADGNVWNLTDGVRLTSGTIEVLADQAWLQLEADELVLGELSGSPVSISDFIEERNERVGGTAQSLTYDSRSGEVHLVGQVTLVVGDNEFTGCSWFYNAIEKTYRSGAAEECDDGFRVLLAPPTTSANQESQPGAP